MVGIDNFNTCQCKLFLSGTHYSSELINRAKFLPFFFICRRERGKAEATMKTFDQKKADEMLAQRRELEMQNMADAAYILCTERLRCSSEKHTMHQCFEVHKFLI